MVIVERAQSLEGAAGGPKSDVAANHLDNIEGFLHLLDPVARQGATHMQGPGSSRRDRGARYHDYSGYSAPEPERRSVPFVDVSLEAEGF